MTRLSAIPDHILVLECSCGHVAEIPVADVVERFDTVAEVRASAVCRECGGRDVLHLRITWALPKG